MTTQTKILIYQIYNYIKNNKILNTPESKEYIIDFISIFLFNYLVDIHTW